MQPSEEIKSRIDIVDLIREYIPVKAVGVNFQARCPFHQEKTPSFVISPDKQIWHCFGCGKGGDIFSFVMEMENLDFVETLRLLAPKAGVTLKREDPKLASERNRLLDIVDLSRRYYHKMLMESPEAESARLYLKDRGLDAEAMEEWQIGYSPDSWDSTLKVLQRNGFRENEIFLAGMIVSRNAGTGQNARTGFYDRFRGRIMFPINDLNGNPVAFSARVSPDKEATEKMGKYINSPQTMIYDKSRILFGLDKAKAAIKKEDLSILVEGQMDAITAHCHGFKNVVASSGTALTADQVALLKRYSPNIALSFDADPAGEQASDRGIREAMAAEMNIRVIEVPQGKDPDECIRQDSAAWVRAVAQAKPMMQYYFDKELGKLDLDKLEHRRQAVKTLLPVIARLGNRIERDHWLRILAGKIDVEEGLLRETLATFLAKTKPQAQARPVSVRTAAPVERLTREERLSEWLLALLLRFPVILNYAINNLLIEHVVGEKNRAVYKNLILYYNNVIHLNGDSEEKSPEFTLDYGKFREWLKSENRTVRSATGTGEAQADPDQTGVDDEYGRLLAYLDRLIILGENEFYDWTEERSRGEALGTLLILRRYYLRQRKREIEKMISAAEKDQDHDSLKALVTEFKLLSDELKELD